MLWFMLIAYGIILLFINLLCWCGMLSVKNKSFKKWFRWAIFVPLLPILVGVIYVMWWALRETKKEFQRAKGD